MKKVTPQPFLPTSFDPLFRLRLLDLIREQSESINQAADLRLFEFVSVSAAYTAGENDHVILVTGGPYTVTLPSASSMRNKQVTVKRADGGTATITIQSSGGNVDGAASTTLTTAYQSRTLFSNGTAWWLI